MSEFTVDYFGGCPKCGTHDGFLSVGREHWFICHMHRVKWCVGANLFDSWKHQDASRFRQNAWLLANYAEVEPLCEGAVVWSSDPKIWRRQSEMLRERAAFQAEMADTPCPF
jgi:hypothetical protein